MGKSLFQNAWGALKKKGIVLTKSIPLTPRPVDFDHAIHKALKREKIASTLKKSLIFLKQLKVIDVVPEDGSLESLCQDIEMRLNELNEVEDT